MQKKRLVTVIAIVAGILFAGSVAYAVFKGDTEDKALNPPLSAPSIDTKINGYDISGIWYSDREDGDRINFENNGKFTSTKWLSTGTYFIDGDTITITSIGESKDLVLQQTGDVYTLFFENGDYSHFYYRSHEEVNAAKQEKERLEGERVELINDAFSQILTNGEWLSDDGNASLDFSATQYTITYTDIEGKPQIREYTYAVNEVSEATDIYYANITRNSENTSDELKVSIAVDGDNYTISCNLFEYARQYKKTKYIEIE